MARKKRTASRSGSDRRAARAQQVQRDLLRFERPFDAWAEAELEFDPPLELLHVLEQLCVAFIFMAGTPRSVTGWSTPELVGLLDALAREDGSGETTAEVAAALEVWTLFLAQTGRWSGGADEVGPVRHLLGSVLTPVEPLLDEDRRARLDAVMERSVDDAALVAALDATRPVRQAVRLHEWFSTRRVANGEIGLDDAVAEAVVDDLADPELDTFRALQLWYALRAARLVHVVDGHVEVTDLGRDGGEPGRAVESRSEVAVSIWQYALPVSLDEDDLAKAVARVLVDLVDGQELDEDDVRALVGDEELAEEVLVRLHSLVDDDAVRLDDRSFSVPAVLGSTIGTMIDEVVLDRLDEAGRDQ